MATLFDTVDTPLVVTSSADQILYANKSFGERTGFPRVKLSNAPSLVSFSRMAGKTKNRLSVDRSFCKKTAPSGLSTHCPYDGVW